MSDRSGPKNVIRLMTCAESDQYKDNCTRVHLVFLCLLCHQIMSKHPIILIYSSACDGNLECLNLSQLYSYIIIIFIFLKQ